MFFHKDWDHMSEIPNFVYNSNCNYNILNQDNKFFMYPFWLHNRTVKFLFLSDCISKLIQKYSLKRGFALYLLSILKKRFLKLYNNNFIKTYNNFKKLHSYISKNIFDNNKKKKQKFKIKKK